MAWKSVSKTGWKSNAMGIEAYRDLRYSIGTFSMGGYGYAAAGLVNGEMLPLAR